MVNIEMIKLRFSEVNVIAFSFWIGKKGKLIKEHERKQEKILIENFIEQHKKRKSIKIMSEVSAFVLVGLVTEEGEKNWSENLVWI